MSPTLTVCIFVLVAAAAYIIVTVFFVNKARSIPSGTGAESSSAATVTVKQYDSTKVSKN